MILCAAIKTTFTRDDEKVTVVIPGHRHVEVWGLMADLRIPREREEVEGFIDHEGNFLDRYDAFEHAVMCGQVSRTTLDHKEERFEVQLYSEDIY